MLEVQLRYGDQVARVARRGASLLGYSVDGREFVDGGDAQDVPAAFDGAILAPWPGRLRDGRWLADGVFRELPVNEPRTGSALHGLVHFADWTPAVRDAAAVSFACAIHTQPGYPFELQLRADYALDDDGLRCELSATNVGRDAAPFGCAAHPYLGNAATRVDDMAMQLAAGTRLVTDERLLPAGHAVVIGTEFDFAMERALDGVRLDTSFTDVARAPDGTSRVRLRLPGAAVEVWADERFGWWQVFTSDAFDAGDPRFRRSVAIEPMSCPPDAFNSGTDLVRIEPGGTWRGVWGIRVLR